MFIPNVTLLTEASISYDTTRVNENLGSNYRTEHTDIKYRLMVKTEKRGIFESIYENYFGQKFNYNTKHK